MRSHALTRSGAPLNSLTQASLPASHTICAWYLLAELNGESRTNCRADHSSSLDLTGRAWRSCGSAWAKGRYLTRCVLAAVAHPLREWVPEAMHCALMLRMSMAAVRFQRG